jgi:hypothetical protein
MLEDWRNTYSERGFPEPAAALELLLADNMHAQNVRDWMKINKKERPWKNFNTGYADAKPCEDWGGGHGRPQ